MEGERLGGDSSVPGVEDVVARARNVDRSIGGFYSDRIRRRDVSLSPAKRRVLATLEERIPEAVTWCVFGSVAAAIEGVDENPSDVDVLTTEAGAELVREAFAEEFVGTTEVGVSQVDEYRLHGEAVEVVYSRGAKDHQEPLVEVTAVELTRTDRGVPVLPPEALVTAYRRMGNEERADRLDAEFRNR